MLIEAGTYTESVTISKSNGVVGALGNVVIQYNGLRGTKDNATVMITGTNVSLYAFHTIFPIDLFFLYDPSSSRSLSETINLLILHELISTGSYGITMLNMSPQVLGIAIVLDLEAANLSFYECTVLGFQDSLWFRNSRVSAYFKNSWIEGGTAKDMKYFILFYSYFYIFIFYFLYFICYFYLLFY
jgi:hypothetical protein